MDLIYNKIFLEHDTGMHPENKKRLLSLGELPESPLRNGEEYLSLVHSEEYIQRVRESKDTHLDPDTVLSSGSYNAAVHAVGATITAAENGGFAIVRPPGHHAYPDRSSGFCIFNNIAIAVQKLVNDGKRVLIFDFDGHLGDGTSKIFYGTDKVLYWSLHQFPAFPGRGEADETGEGAGEGYTINVPLPPGAGDDLFWQGIEKVLPIAKKFNPDIVAVSAGFDAHHSDLLLDLRLSYGTFYRLGTMLKENFQNVFATLEGGYNTLTLPKCLYSFLDGFNGEKKEV